MAAQFVSTLCLCDSVVKRTHATHSLRLPFLGHLATTTVEIPPRGRKSPYTSAHTGYAHFTTSSNTWFTMFSWKIPRLR